MLTARKVPHSLCVRGQGAVSQLSIFKNTLPFQDFQASPPLQLCWKYLGLGRFLLPGKDFIPWGLGVQEGQEDSGNPTAPLSHKVISLPGAHLSGHTQAPGTCVTAHRGQSLGAGASSGSLWLTPLAPAALRRGTLGRKYYTHMGTGSEPELAPSASKEHPTF